MVDWRDAFKPDQWAQWAAVLIGLVALVAAIAAWRQLIRQNRIAAAQLALSRRPKLTIRRIVLDVGPAEGVHRIRVILHIANTGSTPARLVGLLWAVAFNDVRSLPPEPDWDRLDALDNVVAPGDQFTIPFEKTDLSIEDLVAFDSQHFFIVGRLRYLDEGTGNYREVGFCRKYNHKRKRFDLWNDTEYEYED